MIDKNQKNLILLTNDDGIDSEGLLVLARSLTSVGQVVVVAPDRDWSVIGHAKTIARPLQVNKIYLPDGLEAFVIDGTPSDCVSMGLLYLLPRSPDLIVSGINKGPNMGTDTFYSGTVAAALEGFIHGSSAIAVSLAAYSDWNFSAAAFFMPVLSQFVIDLSYKSKILLSVNIPNISPELIQGVEVTRMGKTLYEERLDEVKDSNGASYFILTGKPKGDMAEGTDYSAIAANRISITPLKLDFTDYNLSEELARKLPNLNWSAIEKE